MKGWRGEEWRAKVNFFLPKKWCDVSNVLKEWSYFRCVAKWDVVYSRARFWKMDGLRMISRNSHINLDWVAAYGCMVIVVGSCFEVWYNRNNVFDEEVPWVCGDERRGGRTIPPDAWFIMVGKCLVTSRASFTNSLHINKVKILTRTDWWKSVDVLSMWSVTLRSEFFSISQAMNWNDSNGRGGVKFVDPIGVCES